MSVEVREDTVATNSSQTVHIPTPPDIILGQSAGHPHGVQLHKVHSSGTPRTVATFRRNFVLHLPHRVRSGHAPLLLNATHSSSSQGHQQRQVIGCALLFAHAPLLRARLFSPRPLQIDTVPPHFSVLELRTRRGVHLRCARRPVHPDAQGNAQRTARRRTRQHESQRAARLCRQRCLPAHDPRAPQRATRLCRQRCLRAHDQRAPQ